MSAGEYDRYDRIRGVLAEADEALTAREIFALVEERDESGGIDSPHRVATVLGRRAERGEVEVIAGQPYRYRLET
ncbi:MAG: hypothetical protein ACQERM_03935 [Methanobacteriota archaeon]